MNPLSNLVTNANPSARARNVPARVSVTEQKIENATMGSCSFNGFQARSAFPAQIMAMSQIAETAEALEL